MSVDPNEYDVGELRSIAGVGEDADEADDSDSKESDVVDATQEEGTPETEASGATGSTPDGEDDAAESGPWEPVPSAEDDTDSGLWVSVPDTEDAENATGVEPDESVAADAADDTKTAGEEAEITDDTGPDTDPGLGAADDAEPETQTGTDPDDGASNPFTVDIEPSDSTDPDRSGNTSHADDQKTERGEESESVDGVQATPDDGRGAVDGERAGGDGASTGATPSGVDDSDPLAVLLGETDAVGGPDAERFESGESSEDDSEAGVPDAPVSSDRIEVPDGKPSVNTRTEIADALTATTRGGTKRITRDDPTPSGDDAASPDDTLLDGVPADEQGTVEAADLPDDDVPGASEDTADGSGAETSVGAVAALYNGLDDGHAPAVGDGSLDPKLGPDADAGPTDEDGGDDDLSEAEEIDFGFEESEDENATTRLSEQVADVLYAGEDAPE